ncbi:3-mercaptopyruvate sulfurtransferase [Corynebacterium ciconiae DSM 44920]|uniref:sulfurtransferase n=1 Tax=Corynebacterium ciconiae TaxID=227319 RepID=UPI00035CF59E|nr:sulfurtransferase [Corynebacterium ciconiae]WKD61123.1 3-mercaptopyruvate sulfurtransferase [Corynebacterium ciconiae DSM 44920]
MNAVVSPSWLAERMSSNADNIVLLLAAMGRPRESYTVIPGSKLADIETEFSDTSDRRPHTAPEDVAAIFAQAGVSEETTVVVYDRHGIMVAPRIWWLARQAGIDNVKVLDGGLPAWTAAGFATEEISREQGLEWTTAEAAQLNTQPRDLFVGMDEVESALEAGRPVCDARSAGRFAGTEPEPREGVASGHMPGAVNIPFTSLLDDTQQLRSAEALAERFGEHNQDEELIMSCGSGVTACVLALAATEAGFTNLKVYDGSWSEWAHPNNNKPIEP